MTASVPAARERLSGAALGCAVRSRAANSGSGGCGRRPQRRCGGSYPFQDLRYDVRTHLVPSALAGPPSSSFDSDPDVTRQLIFKGNRHAVSSEISKPAPYQSLLASTDLRHGYGPNLFAAVEQFCSRRVIAIATNRRIRAIEG